MQPPIHSPSLSQCDKDKNKGEKKSTTGGLRYEQFNNWNKVNNQHHHQTREEEIKPKKPWVILNTTSHLPLTDAQPIPEQ